ncbi:MAG TPA: GAF domain-containing protein [Deltaproteobacteria bacterium]|nr:GAF domain-containing protein [Deltaproteobacteria bacterium]
MDEGLPQDVTRALQRVATLDEQAASSLESVLRRVLRAADALSWARERLPALLAAETEPARLQVLIDEAVALTGAPQAWAITWATAGDLTRIRALAGHGGAGRTADGAWVTPADVSRSVLGRVARERRPAWSDDAVADARFLGAESVQAMALRSIGCVPLADRGALYLHDPDTPGRFTPSARARIAALCALLGEILPDPEPGRRPSAPPIEPLPGIVGDTPAMRETIATVRAFAPMPWPVLILGETGTGKEAIAQAIHALSPQQGPFVALNCGTVTPELAESTLFGHARGAFTGADRARGGLVEAATRGTLFLDEIGELAPGVQAKLLRLLQEGTFRRVGDDRQRRFDGRIVAATHRPVDEGGGDTPFREDLYHRLSACVIRVPPLRERLGDLATLADHLLARATDELPGAPPLALADEAHQALRHRPWPGNVRELQNVLKGGIARALARGDTTIKAMDLTPTPTRRAAPPPRSNKPTDLIGATERFQQERVRAALAEADENKTRAAELLGVSRQWLHRLIARWDRQGPW